MASWQFSSKLLAVDELPDASPDSSVEEIYGVDLGDWEPFHVQPVVAKIDPKSPYRDVPAIRLFLRRSVLSAEEQEVKAKEVEEQNIRQKILKKPWQGPGLMGPPPTGLSAHTALALQALQEQEEKEEFLQFDCWELLPITATGGQTIDSLTIQESLQLGFQGVSPDKKKFSVGRGRDCDLVVSDDSKVSRYHFNISMSNAGPIIEDNKTMNGTTVNDEILHGRGVLESGDIIRIGDKTVFRVNRYSVHDCCGCSCQRCEPQHNSGPTHTALCQDRMAARMGMVWGPKA